MARALTRAAQAAKMIRTALRSTGLDVRVKSRNYSMGDAVDVHMTDQKPAIRALVEQYCSHFRAGSFNAMEDLYAYAHRDTTLPQAQYVSVTNSLSDAMREAIYQHMRTAWGGGESLPETYAEGRNQPFHHQYVQDFIYRLFSDKESTFWTARARR